jgi:uncharacterized membrane protein
MNIVLWVLQVLLGLAFLASGMVKATRDRGQLLERMPYVEDLSDGQVRTIGLLEIAGGLGLVLPAATGIAPVLTPLAAVGLAIVMIGATLLHVRRNEPQGIAVTTVLFVGMAVIAWGRFGPYAT